VRLSFSGLIVDPTVPAAWTGFEVTRRWREATYHITVRNPRRVQHGVVSMTLNGKPWSGPIPPQPAGSRNEVLVTLG
jgi:N,N'-diacetylchitobiose phosphorylase